MRADTLVGSHTDTRLTALFPGLPRSAGTRKVKPIWILLKQETVSGNGISWAICKSALRSRQPRQKPTTHFFTGRMPFLPPNQQRQSTEGTVNLPNTGTGQPGKELASDSQYTCSNALISDVERNECFLLCSDTTSLVTVRATGLHKADPYP